MVTSIDRGRFNGSLLFRSQEIMERIDNIVKYCNNFYNKFIKL